MRIGGPSSGCSEGCFGEGCCRKSCCGEGLAQDAGATTVLEPIYVTTPLRRPSTIVQSTSTVTVVTEEDIERSAAVDLPSLLRSYPGVNVTTNGGMGANAGAGAVPRHWAQACGKGWDGRLGRAQP